MTARLKKARTAYNTKNIEATKTAHQTKAIRATELHKHEGSYVGDFVFGAIDGSITTFAVVSGVAGAALSANIVIILGLANLIADGFSMAIGNYLSSKSDIEFAQRERKREEWEVEHYPKGEIAEIRQIFKRKGFKGKQLEDAVKTITSNKKVWVDTMMVDELNLIEEKTSPAKKGMVTFVSFLVVGAIPLLPYFISFFSETVKAIVFPLAVILTLIAFFFIGAAKIYVTGKNWFKSGMQTLLIGSAAAIIAYAIGYLLRSLA
ncbi:MAG: VIT1/CCC1 transporter family protein [Candidatus Woesearchaeota archaeon]|jgi:VIT1/CCC1 family predicted Fe2+/Mn2+ transporter|nr:VIT1/CCC1 transporter family protein [Candidatus Woesearchaeota archaeon]MDP7322657.1 VIT1/CCC1 transporter family protein [Candidatus Woesearchaeota archaeon]MDP7476182.1 VIT1/CCC1 transporter family protein [Candidatus Woesearchaeota archaeon]